MFLNETAFPNSEALPRIAKTRLGERIKSGRPAGSSSEGDDDGSRVGQGDLSGNGRPTTERGPLEMKEEKDATKEAFDAAAFAQFRFRPSGRQAGAVLLTFGVPGYDGYSAKRGMDPADEAQPPIGSIQADHPRANVVEMHGPLQARTGKRRIMDIGS